MFLMVCIAVSDYPPSHPSTQQITNLIKNGVETGVTPAYNTTNTLMNYHVIYLYVVSHAVKLLKFPYFSADLLYTQLFLVLHPIDLNVNFIPITRQIDS